MKMNFANPLGLTGIVKKIPRAIIFTIDYFQICSAVCTCRASHFAHQAVEYRRQHGQPIMSGMGVVLQEMVPSQTSGTVSLGGILN